MVGRLRQVGQIMLATLRVWGDVLRPWHWPSHRNTGWGDIALIDRGMIGVGAFLVLLPSWSLWNGWAQGGPEVHVLMGVAGAMMFAGPVWMSPVFLSCSTHALPLLKEYEVNTKYLEAVSQNLAGKDFARAFRWMLQHNPEIAEQLLVKTSVQQQSQLQQKDLQGFLVSSDPRLRKATLRALGQLNTTS